jgi:dTDP-4-amino-4,6-dideoxygalactose transaminase
VLEPILQHFCQGFEMLKAINELDRHNAAVGPEIEEAMLRVARSGWYVLGKEVKAFEDAFAEFCGVSHCVGLANGTDALELALKAVGVQARDEVITVANAGMYSTVGILAAGATPRYVDASVKSLTMAPDCLTAAIGKKTAAVIVTHLYGQLAAIEEIRAITVAAGIPLIEDCAQAHGAMLNGKRAGSWGDIGCFSFYPTKNLGALGDGGAIVTNRQEVAANVLKLRQYGWASKYSVALQGGRNSRLDEMQAAVLSVKLPKLDGWNARRRSIANTYCQLIDNPAVQVVNRPTDGFVSHLFVIRSMHRESLRAHLKSLGIPSEVHYPILDCQQQILLNRLSQIALPVSELACNEILTLPCFPEMTDIEVSAVVFAVQSWKSKSQQ